MSLRSLTSNRLHFAAIAGLAILVLPPHANAAGTTLSDGWIRRLPGDLPAAGYFTLMVPELLAWPPIVTTSG